MPRSETAYDEDAELILNQKKSSFSLNEDIRTPGLAKNVVRMGDMRVSCEVLVGMAKKEMGFFFKSLISTFLMKIDWCETKHEIFSFPVGDWAISMKKIVGEQESLVKFKGATIYPQFWDKSISPDTLYAFELWSDLSPARKQEVIDQQLFTLTSNDRKNPQKYVFKRIDKNRYSVDISLKAGVFHFFLGSDNDAALAFAPVDSSVNTELGQSIALQLAANRSSFKIEQAGTYQFQLDLSEVEQAQASIKFAKLLVQRLDEGATQ